MMMKLFAFLFVLLAGVSAHAEKFASIGFYSGVPKFEFRASAKSGEEFDSAAALTLCKKELSIEKAKVVKLGVAVLQETACYEEYDNGVRSVRGSFVFYK